MLNNKIMKLVAVTIIVWEVLRWVITKIWYEIVNK